MATQPRIAALHPSPYGVNSHSAPDDLLAELAGIGVRWHRIDVDWDLTERAASLAVERYATFSGGTRCRVVS